MAVKVLPQDFVSDPDRLHRFELEGKTVASLNHPNILTIHHAGLHDGTPYLVSELLEGRTLREELASGQLSMRKATDYALQIANGLAAAHARGIIHRDLKPENLDTPAYMPPVIQQFLRAHRVTVVPSLAAARSALTSGSFDLVLSDYDLDDGKGETFVRECRATHPLLPVVAVSSHEPGNAALVAAGASAVCGKMEFDRIQEIIQRFEHERA